MDSTQEQHERAVADAFVDWLNHQNGTGYIYDRRGADPPDLVYRCGDHELHLEITAAYYDAANATMLWQDARAVPGAPDMWSSKSPDQKLVGSVNSALAKKCAKPYPPGCVLLVALYPDLTSAEELADLTPEISVPADHSFAGIYVGGMFPVSSHGSPGGYHCWKLV